MKIAHKIAFGLAVITLCATLAVGAQAAKKPVPKPVKKPTVQLIKKLPTTKKTVIQPTKKQPVSTKKTPTQKPISTNPTIPPTLPPTTTAPSTFSYPWHDNVLATQFFIGENGLKGTTAWDCHAVTHYGGVDSPFGRKNYLPTFTPKENPFYLALPYTDIGDAGAHKKDIPWYDAKLDTGENYSFVKNRWVQVKRGDKVCYGQWEDSLTPDILDPTTGKRIGYGKPNHFDYVFGSAPATHPGIDVSPALSDCLGMDDPSDTQFGHSDGLVSWKFVSDTEVPEGAWKNIITATPVSWDNCQ